MRASQDPVDGCYREACSNGRAGTGEGSPLSQPTPTKTRPRQGRKVGSSSARLWSAVAPMVFILLELFWRDRDLSLSSFLMWIFLATEVILCMKYQPIGHSEDVVGGAKDVVGGCKISNEQWEK